MLVVRDLERNCWSLVAHIHFCPFTGVCFTDIVIIARVFSATRRLVLFIHTFTGQSQANASLIPSHSHEYIHSFMQIWVTKCWRLQGSLVVQELRTLMCKHKTVCGQMHLLRMREPFLTLPQQASHHCCWRIYLHTWVHQQSQSKSLAYRILQALGVIWATFAVDAMWCTNLGTFFLAPC